MSENDCPCEPIKNASEPNKEPEEIEWVSDETTDGEYLAMCVNAISVADMVNAMTSEDIQTVKEIKEMSLAITHKIIKEVHVEFFNEDEAAI